MLQKLSSDNAVIQRGEMDKCHCVVMKEYTKEEATEGGKEKRREAARVPPDSCTSTGEFVSDSSVSIGGGGADRYPYPVWAGLSSFIRVLLDTDTRPQNHKQQQLAISYVSDPSISGHSGVRTLNIYSYTYT